MEIFKKNVFHFFETEKIFLKRKNRLNFMIICKQVASPFLGKKPFNLFIKMGQSRPLFVYFRPFHITISIIQIEKSLDGVLGIQTCGRRMVGADETIAINAMLIILPC